MAVGVDRELLMAINQERSLLLELWNRQICPFCGRIIPDGTRVGTGRKQDGGFCSLDCFARYRDLELLDRIKLLKQRC